MEAESVFDESQGPLKQGDILMAPIARVVSPDRKVPRRWDGIDQMGSQVNRSIFGDEDLHVFSGRALVMVTSHDCHHHKEWNTERRRLIKSCFSDQEAQDIANSDDNLDRTFHASPLVPLTDLDENNRGHYRAGRMVGFFPLPAAPDDAFPESVVDLTYRCTVDKKAIGPRRWCLSPTARDRLRYAIARFDSFRTVQVVATIEVAIGKSIASIEADKDRGLPINLTLDDGSVLQVIQPPVEPDPSGRPTI